MAGEVSERGVAEQRVGCAQMRSCVGAVDGVSAREPIYQTSQFACHAAESDGDAALRFPPRSARLAHV